VGRDPRTQGAGGGGMTIVPARDAVIRQSSEPLAAAVARRITQDIINAGWPVGEALGSEPQLLERYGVSRPVLREAGRILESQRVARMRRGPGGGLVVLAPDGSAVSESAALYLEYLAVDPQLVHDARISIELTCVEQAAHRVTEDDIGRLRATVRDEPRKLASGELL